MHWLGFVPWWIWVPYLIVWLYVMATLIMEDREPADTLAWAFALLLVPVLGMVFYFIARSAEIFPTGEEKFGRLKDDLAAAERFIHIQYFIWEDDELTDALTEILKERVQAGVQVRFLYDYLGSKAWDKKKLEALVPLGAKVAKDVVSLSHLNSVSYTHLRADETDSYLVCRI